MILKRYKGNKYVDMRKLVFEHTYNVVTGMIKAKARGSTGEAEAEAFQEIVGEMSKVTLEANAVDFLPILRCVGFGVLVERKMRSVQEKRDKFMENVLREWQREDDDDDDNGRCGQKQESLIEVLQELKREEPDTYNDETIRNLLLVRMNEFNIKISKLINCQVHAGVDTRSIPRIGKHAGMGILTASPKPGNSKKGKIPNRQPRWGTSTHDDIRRGKTPVSAAHNRGDPEDASSGTAFDAARVIGGVQGGGLQGARGDDAVGERVGDPEQSPGMEGAGEVQAGEIRGRRRRRRIQVQIWGVRVGEKGVPWGEAGDADGGVGVGFSHTLL